MTTKKRGPKFAGKSETTEAPAQIGDNVPPSETEALRQNLDEKTQALRERMRDLQVGLARVPDPITEENASQVTDFIGQVKRCLRDVEAKRKECKAPLDEQAKALQRYFKGISDPGQAMLGPVEQRYGAYVRKREAEERERLAAEQRKREEEERKAAEEATQKQREAEEAARKAESDEDRRRAALQMEQAERARQQQEDAAEAAKKAERAATGPIHQKGSLGATGYTARTWKHEIIDRDAIPLEKLRPYLKDEHLAVAIRAYMAAHAEEIRRDGEKSAAAVALAGVRIFEDTDVRVKAS